MQQGYHLQGCHQGPALPARRLQEGRLESPWKPSHFLGYWVPTVRAGARGVSQSFNVSSVWAMRSWPCSNLGNYIFPYADCLPAFAEVDLRKRVERGLPLNLLFLPS